MTAEQVRQARDLLTRPGNTVSCKAPAARRQPSSHLQARPWTPRPDPASCGPARRAEHGGQRPCRPEGPADSIVFLPIFAGEEFDWPVELVSGRAPDYDAFEGTVA